MTHRLSRWTLAPAIAAVLMVAACGGGDGSSAKTGDVSVSLTDSPVADAEKVVVTVSGLAFKADGAAPELVETFAPRQIDLLQYQQGNVAVLLEDTPMPAGRYQWLRLIIDTVPNVQDSYIQLVGGEMCELTVPSGAESGLKMMRPIDVPAGGSLALTIDFDLHKSVHAPPGQASGACAAGYLLRPTLRLVNDANVGAIAGTVDFTAVGSVPEGCEPRVHVYEGSVVPDDEEVTTPGADVDAMSIIDVDIPAGSLTGNFRAAFIPAGNYVAAFTCDVDTDADEDLVFEPEGGELVTVQNNLISTVDFVIPAAP